MKRRMIWTSALLAGVLGVAGTAAAGMAGNTRVTVVEGSYGKGALTPTRNSNDSVQYIGCSRYAYGSGSNTAICYARSDDYDYISCSTSKPEHLAVIEGLNSASYLYFTVNGGSCQNVISVVASYNLPAN